jgi:hypothetical protein
VTCWADIGTSISGSLTASIAGNTPFALLVEAAFTMSAVTFADTYDLMPSQPGPGDLTILAREERFLADGLWDWAAGGRLTMAEIMSSLFSDA